MKPNDRQYSEMRAAAVDRLRNVDAAEIAANAGIKYSKTDKAFTFQSLGEAVRIDARDFRAAPELEMWHHLSILQYLGLADGGVPGEAWLAMGELPGGGLVRGASFDREVDAIIANSLGPCPPDAIRAACERLGGVFLENPRADLSAAFHFMPKYPLLLNLWYADDEFPASGKLLVNRGVRHHLGVEATGTVGLLLIRRLSDLARQAATN